MWGVLAPLLFGLLGAAASPASAQANANTSDAPKVLRYAFRAAETGFDPAQISDSYSKAVAAGIFDAPLEFEYHTRPAKLRPNTLVAMPEVSADFKTLTFELKPGIYFDDHEVFGGKKRELVAADYVYSIKRHYDPVWKSPNLYLLENVKILGLSELRKELMAAKKPFDYERPVEGLQVISRYKFQIKLGVGDPRFINQFADAGFLGAVAREVVEKYGLKVMEHPVGTNAWRLAEWRRSSQIVLEKNPNFRELRYSEVAPSDNPALAAQVAALQGRRMPMVDKVVISIIEEAQPRWLSFVNGEKDVIEEVPADFATIAMPGNKLAPNLAKRGFQLFRVMGAESAFTFFNLEDKTLGGYSEDKVALRRALSLALNIDREINGVRRGQAVPAQSMIPPHTSGYDAAYKSTNSDFDIPRAKALLDLYGYVDRDGDGWRDMPDEDGAGPPKGQKVRPLVIEVATQPDALSRQYDELWQRNFAAVNIRTKFFHGKWPEQLKQARAGKLMLWMLADSANSPDGLDQMLRLYSPAIGARNYARFKSAEFDKLYERLQVMPDGPEREALFLQAKRIVAAYVPEKTHVHRIINDMSQAWVIGYRRPLFSNDFWQYIDVDPSLKPKP